jgi:hypothetical protein
MTKHVDAKRGLGTAFGPKTLDVMSDAYRAAQQELVQRGSRNGAGWEQNLASRIVRLAARGERDRSRLRRFGLRGFDKR